MSETRFRVRYAETDQMGVVYHSNFIIWMEVGRVELLRALGYTYREMEQDGYHLPVAEVKCRYKAPARYDDLILVRTKIINLRGYVIHFFYEILRDADGTLLAEGESVHIVVGPDMQKTPLPEKYKASLMKAMGS
ncbi:MAG: acyl-CoA thioesterase [Acidobacteriaceae bacterium]